MESNPLVFVFCFVFVSPPPLLLFKCPQYFVLPPQGKLLYCKLSSEDSTKDHAKVWELFSVSTRGRIERETPKSTAGHLSF